MPRRSFRRLIRCWDLHRFWVQLLKIGAGNVIHVSRRCLFIRVSSVELIQKYGKSKLKT